MKFKIKYSDQITGILAFIAVAALIVLLFAIGTKQRWFSRKYYFVTEFTTAANLTRGMPVKYKGFDIGKISDISLTPKDSVAVEFYVYSSYYDKIKTGAVVDLEISVIGLGSQFLLYPGKGRQLVMEGSFIPRRDSSEGKLLIAEGKANVPNRQDAILAIIDTTRSLVRTLESIFTKTDEALSGNPAYPLGAMFRNLSTTSSYITDITKDLEQLAAGFSDPEGLIPRLIGTEGSAGRLFSDNDELYNSVVNALDAVAATLDNVESISSNIKNITGSVDTELPQMYSLIQEVQSSLLMLQDVLEGLRNNPLLRGGIPERPEAEDTTPQFRSPDF